MDGHLTLGILALQLGVQPHQIQRLAAGGKIPYERAGRFRLVKREDVETVRKACIDAGYLKPVEAGGRDA